MSEDEYDEDLRRAIALSLMAPEPQRDVILIDDSDEQDDDDLDKPRSTRPNANQVPPLPLKETHKDVIDLSRPVQLSPGTQRVAAPVAAGLHGLNRKEMEDERLARAALRRKRDEDASTSSRPAQKRKASKSPVPSQDHTRRVKDRFVDGPKPLLRKRVGPELADLLVPISAFTEGGRPDHPQRGKRAFEIGPNSLQEPLTSPSDLHHKIPNATGSITRQQVFSKRQSRVADSPGIQYPEGIVKKTWAFGYDRKGDDIKIEEVLQKGDLELAVLSSFQIDADCKFSDFKPPLVTVENLRLGHLFRHDLNPPPLSSPQPRPQPTKLCLNLK
jgi:hypothetical protein